MRRPDADAMRSARVLPEMNAAIAVPGASEWLALSDELLAGLVHALNNRITALSVCAELVGLGDEQMQGDGVLLTEVRRLQRAGALIGLLPARGQAEPLALGAVLDDAIAIHAHHPRRRTIACVVESAGRPADLHVPRWALLRLLILIVDAAKSAAVDAGRSEARVHLSGDAGAAVVRAAALEGAGAYAMELTALCGATLAQEESDLVLTLPTVVEPRRDEPAED